MIQDRHVWWSKPFAGSAPRGLFQPVRDLASDISPKKILWLAAMLTISSLCWLGVGCIAVEMVRLAAH